MMPILLEIGSVLVHGYAVMLIAAFVVGNWVLSRGLCRQGIDPALGPTITALALVFGIAGAKALWVLQHWPRLLDAPVAMLLGGGGMVWYGGLAAATTAIVAYLRWQRVPVAIVL